jgi:hypothetical protein
VPEAGSRYSKIMERALRVRLTGRAAKFLQMLQDFGHLDEERSNEVFLALAEHGSSRREVILDLPAVRRVAAAVVFGGAFEDPDERIDPTLLAEDWPLLFS